MKKTAMAAALSILLSANLVSNPVFPGITVFTASSWEGEFSLASLEKTSPETGFGARGGLSFEGLSEGLSTGGLPFGSFSGILNFGYRWINRDGGILPIPNAGIRAGYRIPVPGFVSFTPLAGADLNLEIGNGTVLPVFDLAAGIRVSVLLAKRDYLAITPSFSLPLTSSWSPRFTVSAGTRRETPWFIPVPEAKPELKILPGLFSPDGDGIDDTATFSIGLAAPEAVKTWKISVVAQDDGNFAEFKGEGRPPENIPWDGTSVSGGEPEPATDFRVVLETKDTLGRVAQSEAAVTIDILVVRDGERFKIKVPDIRFPSYSSELSAKESNSLLEENRAVLARIAALFARFPGYSLIIEGHANSVDWKDPEAFKIEHETILIPLSKMRAESVRQALILLGVADSRISAAGLGGSRPVAPFSDSANAWKNRRVEFILSK